MAGGLMQLVAYGAQDIYLTSNPQITFFKSVYRRHTNFATESIEQTFNGNANFGKKCSATIARSGDAINRMTLELTLPSLSVASSAYSATSFKWCSDVGFHVINSVNVEIGGQEMDKHYGAWMYIWTQLTTEDGLMGALNKAVGNRPTNSANGDQDDGAWALSSYTSNHREATKLYVPLQFWFNRNIGLSLPLIALQYHEVKVNLELRNHSELVFVNEDDDGTGVGTYANIVVNGGDSVEANCALWVDYVYFDTDERRRFAQVSHEYLIEQVQQTDKDGSVTSSNSTSVSMDLHFNHPVKALFVTVQADAMRDAHLHSCFADKWPVFADEFAEASPAGGKSPVGTMKLVLNGHDRFAPRDANYFNVVQPLYHATRATDNVGILLYSFSQKFAEHQPGGALNMSRIDNAKLILTGIRFTTTGEWPDSSASTVSFKVQCYGVNYNVLRIMSGMGGLAYSN
jgi:hypothetical protein